MRQLAVESTPYFPEGGGPSTILRPFPHLSLSYSCPGTTTGAIRSKRKTHQEVPRGTESMT